MQSARLILKSGDIYKGMSTRPGTTFGELVFNTSMMGYVEAMTDPSYKNQILVFTYPLMGNYGVPDQADWESNSVQVAGIVVSELCLNHQHSEAKEGLLEFCNRHQVPIFFNADTRALAKHISHHGVAPACVTTEEATPTEFKDINEEHLVREVAIKEPIEFGEGDKKIIVVDCGIKQNILRHFKRFPVRVKQVSFDYDFTNEDYDAVFFSNGPGDPERCVETIEVAKKVLQGDKPVFGICLGSQIMALAIGAKTYKLSFGHRAQNHPCQDLQTERCYLTSQNHGFCIKEDSLPNDWQVRFRNLNDNTVQGIEHKTKPFFSVQFHPEAAPGPVDTEFLFDRFYDSIIHGERRDG